MFRRGDEPIPGYCLEKSLGRGNYGEVWRASAGGKQVALKFIDISQRHGLKELRGLQRVKDIDHNYLMPITGLWLLDETGRILPFEVVSMVELCSPTRAGRPHRTMVATARPTLLIVAMLLGQRSLMDCLRDVNSGLPDDQFTRGIPHGELLNYMQQTAEGIDFLNSPLHDLGEGQAAIQHGDIKPDNIMLRPSGSVAICDFGLATILGEQAKATATARGMVGTTAYMSPEAIEAKLGPASDQYSFAITYYELRTGRLPFDSLSPTQVVLAHRTGNLCLGGLQYEQERAIIRQATALAPEERFPTCSAMVSALCEAARATGSAEVAPPRVPFAPAPSDGDPETRTARDTRSSSPDARDTVPTPIKNVSSRWFFIRPRYALAGVALLLILALCLSAWHWRRHPPAPPTLTVQFIPTDVEVSINGDSYNVDHLGRVHPRPAEDGRFELRVVPHSPGYSTLQRSLTTQDFRDGELKVHLDKAPQVALCFEPPDVSVFVNGRRLILDEGIGKLAFRPDGAIDLEVIPKEPGLETFNAKVDYSELQQSQFTLRLRRSSESFATEAREAFKRDEMAAGCRAFAELAGRNDPAAIRQQKQIVRLVLEKAEQYAVGGSLQKADDALSAVLAVIPDDLVESRIEAKLALAHARAQRRDWQSVAQLLEEPRAFCSNATDLDDRLLARFWALTTFHRTVLAQEDYLQSPVLEGLAFLKPLESRLGDWAASATERLKATVLQKALARFHDLSEDQRGSLKEIFGENLPLQSGLLTARDLAKKQQFVAARQLLDQLASDNAGVTSDLDSCSLLIDLQDPSQDLACVINGIHNWISLTSPSPDSPRALPATAPARDLCFCLVDRMQRDCNRLAREAEILATCHLALDELRPNLDGEESANLELRLLALDVLLSLGDDAGADEQRLHRFPERGQFAQGSLSKACWTECVLQSMNGAAKPERTILQRIDLALSTGDDDAIAHFTPYIQYVQGLLAHRVPRDADTEHAARAMMLAFQGPSDPPALEQPRRKQQAAEVLLATVRRRLTGHEDDVGTPAFSREDADKALEYLGLIDKLGVPISAEHQALLAQALYHASKSDRARAHSLCDELVAAESPAVTARIHMIHALAQPSTPDGAAVALKSFAAALQRWSQHEFDNGATVYRDFVVPALDVVQQVARPDEAQAICMARIYSCQGILILHNTDVQIQLANQDQHPFEMAYEAFAKAADIEPLDPLHLIHQGRALVGIERYNREACLPMLRQLAAAALRLAPRQPGAVAFQAYVQLLAATGESNVALRRTHLRKAEDLYTAAIDLSSETERHLAEYYEGRSTVRVEIAILQPDEPSKRQLLEAAIADASRATQIPRRARAETAYHAWGTALQQRAILLKEYTGFDQAIQQFEKALESTRGSRRSWAATALNLGRCHFLCVKHGHIPAGSSPSEQLRFAEQYLTEAASVWNDMPPTRSVRSSQAQIHTFASAVYLFRAKDQQDDALYGKADDECAAAARLAWEAKDSTWPQYQTNWAELAWQLGSSDILANPEQRQTKRQQALGRFEQLLQRASEYVALRDFVSAGPAIATARCGLPVEIDPATSLTPWQTLATEQLRFHPQRPGLPVPLALRQNALERLYAAATDVPGRIQWIDRYLLLFPPDRGTAGQLRTEWLVRRSSDIVRWWILQNTWNEYESVARSDALAAVDLARRLSDARHRDSLQIDGLTILGMIDCRTLDDIRREHPDRVNAGKSAEQSLHLAIRLCGDNVPQSIVARTFRARALQGLLVLSNSPQQKKAHAKEIHDTLVLIEKQHVPPENWETIQQLRFFARPYLE